MRRLLVPLVMLVFAGAAVPAAQAATAPCPDGWRCLEVTVPLDRSGTTPGTLTLPVRVQAGTGPVLVALAGGPGQGAVAFADGFASELGPASGRRVAVFDQRGTGATALACPTLQHLPLTDFSVPPAGSVEACGTALGARRSFFSTTDTVADLEAVRAAIGAERIALYGVSYGTYVVERYARAHPDRVDALVLDSVVPQENVDPFFRASLRQAGSDLRALCATRACRRISADPAADLAAVVRSAQHRPLSGRVGTGGGRSVRVTVDGPGLFDAMTTWASFLPALLAQAPAALAEARRGRSGPLLRLVELARRANPAFPAADLSWGLHSATLCADMAAPWGGPASDPATRQAALRTAERAITRSSVAPFDAATAAGNGAILTCARWPATTVAPPPAPGPLPDVPTLVMTGAWDMSTPPSEARKEAARAPSGRLVVIPQAGHSVLSSTGCGVPLVQRFFAGESLDRVCAANRAPAAVALPRREGDLRGGRAQRARTAVRLTLRDATAVGAALGGTGRFGGVVGGTLTFDRTSGTELRADELVAGAPVTGTIARGGTGRVHVGGRVRADVRLRGGEITAVRLR